MELVADSPESALDMATSMCERLLANPVTEDFQIQILEENENSE